MTQSLKSSTDMFFISFSVVPPAPGRPKIQNLKDTSAFLEWESFSDLKYTSSSETVQCNFIIEACRLRSVESWTTIDANIETNQGTNGQTNKGSCTVGNLKQGETYTFRVIASASSNVHERDVCSQPSPPSNPLTIPLGDLPSANVGSATQGALSSRRSSTSSGSGSCSGLAPLHVSYIINKISCLVKINLNLTFLLIIQSHFRI